LIWGRQPPAWQKQICLFDIPFASYPKSEFYFNPYLIYNSVRKHISDIS
jgi:hypothetical protein